MHLIYSQRNPASLPGGVSGCFFCSTPILVTRPVFEATLVEKDGDVLRIAVEIPPTFLCAHCNAAPWPEKQKRLEQKRAMLADDLKLCSLILKIGNESEAAKVESQSAA